MSRSVRLIILGISAAIIAACSSPPKRETTSRTPVVTPTQDVSQSRTATQWLAHAEQQFMQSGDVELRNASLLEAAQAFLNEQQCQKSQQLLRVVLPELTSPEHQTHAYVILAECELKKAKPDTQTLSTLVARMHAGQGFDPVINRLTYVIAKENEQWIGAAQAALNSDIDAAERDTIIWSLLQNLTDGQLEQARLRHPSLQPWLQLSLIVRRYGTSPSQLIDAVSEWRSRHPQHSLAISLPENLIQAMTVPRYGASSVAVVLPLSGRLSLQGQAIKEGVLAAYLNGQQNQGRIPLLQNKVVFLDSETLTEEAFVSALENVDFVVGPLMKDKITRFIPLVPENIPVLALNRLTEQSASSDDVSDEPAGQVAHRYYFALAPEDEAVQLVRKVRNTGAVNPIIVAHDSATMRRMADAFMTKWMALPGSEKRTPQITFFKDNESMRDGVTKLLDVVQSKDRIKQIERLLRPELHSVARNRRDIDAIIIFASPEQTELLNPIIESSQSPFNDKAVPVFASSRSYSLNLNQNSLRDLRNLTFTDMPWMLPAHQWQRLERTTQALWPQRNDTLRRLFAMGYDAYTLLPDLHHMRLLPQVTQQGLTGKLHVSEEGHILRRLAFGRIDNDKVTLIAMD